MRINSEKEVTVLPATTAQPPTMSFQAHQDRCGICGERTELLGFCPSDHTAIKVIKPNIAQDAVLTKANRSVDNAFKKKKPYASSFTCDYTPGQVHTLESLPRELRDRVYSLCSEPFADHPHDIGQ